MKYYTNYKYHESDILGKKKKVDNTIYSFDIETSNYLILDNIMIPACDYETLSEEDRKRCIKQSNMYIWQFSINDEVYFGRTWKEFKEFLDKLEENVPEKKIVFIHNLAFEFQYLKGVFPFEVVFARKSRKVMYAVLENYNIELRCTYMMSNCKLEKLPSVYQLPVEKQVGALDYDKIRHSLTPLTEQELKYCEYDCLVVYEYIKKELLTYIRVDKIPLTSTGHVRRELKQLVSKNYQYRNYVRRAINTDPHVYNLLVEAFAGGYTHANWIYTDNIIKNVTSFDFCSSYPYVLTNFKFPATEFKKCNIQKIEDLSDRFAYLIVIRMTNVNSKFFNNFLSMSKCRHIRGGKYDNGRIMSADTLETTITDVDLKILKKAYSFDYELLEVYYSFYRYLPKQYINFILDKYVAKTQYKDVEDKKLEYQLEKAKFNALFGMTCTNTIRADVIYDNDTGWSERELTNDEILEKLNNEKKKAFLSYAYGVWCTSWARYNLLINVIKEDKFTIYCDTDSIKMCEGYDENAINDYNKKVEHKINYTSSALNIPLEKFAPKDVYGHSHMLGLFERDAFYEKFITQGAKKYAYQIDGKIHITVSGVPKDGAKALKRLENFKDNFVFKHEDTNKNTLQYNDDQVPFVLLDYLGNVDKVYDKSGCCILPATYELNKSEEYANLVSDNSSDRAIYKEG